MDRRKFLASGVMLAGALSLPSIAHATSPSPAFVWVKLIVLDYQGETLDQDLWSVMPVRDDVLPSLANDLRSRIAEAGVNIHVVERPTYVSQPEGVTEAQTMHATVLLDLARWQHGNTDVVGGTHIWVLRTFPHDTVTQLLRPTAFFGAAARAESVKQQFAKAAGGPLDQLVREITAYK
jgi:hypothetical protein